MGTLTLSQLQTEVLAAHGNRGDYSEDRRIVALNIAQTRIARAYDWNELWAIDTGTIGDAADVTVDKFENTPTNIRRIYSFRIVDAASKQNSRKLRFVHQKHWDEEIPETEAWATETPSIYTIWKRSGNFVFELWQIPDTSYNYEIRSAKWPTNFVSTSPTATSDLDDKDDMIIALAASWLFLTGREMEEANRWWAVYKEMLNNAADQDIEQNEIDLKAPLEMALRGDLPGVEPWKDPFNRSGTI